MGGPDSYHANRTSSRDHDDPMGSGRSPSQLLDRRDGHRRSGGFGKLKIYFILFFFGRPIQLHPDVYHLDQF